MIATENYNNTDQQLFISELNSQHLNTPFCNCQSIIGAKQLYMHASIIHSSCIYIEPFCTQLVKALTTFQLQLSTKRFIPISLKEFPISVTNLFYIRTTIMVKSIDKALISITQGHLTRCKTMVTKFVVCNKPWQIGSVQYCMVAKFVVCNDMPWQIGSVQ